jgi:ferric-dicitrate binding protein FerR (iron transport regulator)
LRVVGVLFTLLGAGAAIGGMGAAVSYGLYAFRPDRRTRRRANRLFLTALACAAAVVLLFALGALAGDLGVDFSTDRPQ